MVGSTFDSLIMGSDKDTLIMFRTPDCPMCEELVEELISVANHMEFMAPGAFQAAHIDSSLNDYPASFRVRLLPLQSLYQKLSKATPFHVLPGTIKSHSFFLFS